MLGGVWNDNVCTSAWPVSREEAVLQLLCVTIWNQTLNSQFQFLERFSKEYAFWTTCCRLIGMFALTFHDVRDSISLTHDGGREPAYLRGSKRIIFSRELPISVLEETVSDIQQNTCLFLPEQLKNSKECRSFWKITWLVSFDHTLKTLGLRIK